MSSKRNAKLLKAVLSAAPAICMLGGHVALGQNTSYIYTPGGDANDLWSAGTSWSPSAPVSGTTTALVFVNPNTATLTAGQETTTTNDLAGTFKLNELTLQGTGFSAGFATAITVAGNMLEFDNNGMSDPVVNLNANSSGSAVQYNIGNNISLANNLTFQGSGTAGFNFSGNISGADGITKTGTSILILSGTNTYLGMTTISGGTLRATQTSALSGYNSTGSVNLLSGTLGVSAGGTGWSSSDIDTLLSHLTSSAGSNFAINVDGANNFTYNSNITNTLALTKSGNGVLNLGGINSYTGNTNLTGGQLNLTAASAIGASTLVVSGNSFLDNTSGSSMLLPTTPVTLNGTLNFNGTNDLTFAAGTVSFTSARGVNVRSHTLTFGGPLNGAAGLVKGGAGTLAIPNSANVYTDTTINGGVLSVGTTGILGSGAMTEGNGELNIASPASGSSPRAITITAATFSTGRNVITLAADPSQPTTLTIGSLSNRVLAGSTVGTVAYSTTLYRGTNLGGTPGAGVANIFFGSPSAVLTPSNTISGTNSFAATGSGISGSDEAAVLRGALYDPSATGTGQLANGEGSFATYQTGVGVRGLNPLTEQNTSQTPSANKNVRLSLAAGSSSYVGAQFNTLQLDNLTNALASVTFTGGTAFNPVNGLLFTGNSSITLTGASALTFGTGAAAGFDGLILSTNTAGVAINTALAAAGSSNHGFTFGGTGNIAVNAAITGLSGQGGVAMDGTGVLTLNGAVTLSSNGLDVNSGTVAFGSGFSLNGSGSSRNTTIANGAAIDLNGTSVSGFEGFSDFNGAGGLLTNSSTTFATATITHAQDVTTSRSFSGIIGGNLNLVLNAVSGVTGVQTFSGASTYLGFTTISSGTLNLGINNTLPTSTALTVSGGGADVSVLDLQGFSQTVNSLSGTGLGTIQNSAFNTASVFTVGGAGVGTFAGVIADNNGAGGKMSLVRSGTGELNLNGTGSYSGTTTVSGGTFRVNGALTGNGAVTVSAGTLGGGGSIAGAVTVLSGAHIAPGASGVGTLTLKSTLSVASGTEFDYELIAPLNNDVIDVSTGTNPFTLNGGAFNLLTPGGTSPFSDPGTYDLIKYAGTIQGAGTSSLTVMDPQLFKSYAFGTANVSGSTFVTLTISSTTVTGNWTGTTSNSWGSGVSANWGGGTAPGVQGDIAVFGSGASRFLVNLDTNKTVGAITFNSTTPYTIAQGSPGGTLFMDESTAVANITDTNGSHTISAPISLTSNTTVNVANAGDTMTLSGNLGGASALTKAGNGTLILGGNNLHVGGTMINAGTVVISADNNLGPGQTTINGGALSTSTTIATARNFQLGSASSTMDVEGTASLELDGSVANAATSGTLNKTGPGTLIINGNVTASGGVAIAAGNVQLGNGTTSGSLNSGPLSIGTLTTFTVNRTGSTVIGGPVSGTGSMNLLTGSNVTLGGNNAGYSGSISITGATLVLGNTSGVGSANIGLNNATLSENTSATIFDGVTTSYTGMNVVGASTIDTGAFKMALTALLTGSGTITRIGSGTLSLGLGANTNFSNSFVGGTFINNSGTLDFASRLSGSRDASWIINGGAITISQPNGGSTEYGLLQSNDPTVSMTLTAATGRISIGNVGGLSSFAGSITTGGSWGLAKVGTGTLTLSGQNTFGGTDGVTISGSFAGLSVVVGGGTLVALSSTTGNTSGPFGGAPTYNASGTLTSGAAILLGATGTLTTAAVMTGGPVTVANDIVTSGGDGTMETAGSYTLTIGGTTDNASTFSGKILLQNNLTVSQVATTGTNALLLSGGIYGQPANIGPGIIQPQPVIGAENTGLQMVTFAGAGSINVTGNIGDSDPNPTDIYGIIYGGGVVAVSSTGGTTKLTGNNNYSGGTTIAGGTLIVSSSAQGPVLSGPGHTIVNAGRLVLDYSGANNESTVVSQVTSSLNRAQFLNQFQSSGGTQIYTTNATESTQAHGLGWFDNPTTKQLTVRYTWLGDANLDGTVNALDLNAVATDFGKSSQVWGGGDFDYTGNVNVQDFNYIAMNFGQVMAAAPLPGQPLLGGQLALGTLVPEPASLGLIGLGMALGVRRRRR